MRESSAAAAEFVEHGESGESSVDADHGLDGAETSLRRVIDTIPALAWCARPDGWMEYVNKRWRDYTGLSPAETVGYGYQAAFHPEDQKDKGERCNSAKMGHLKVTSGFDAMTECIAGFLFA